MGLDGRTGQPPALHCRECPRRRASGLWHIFTVGDDIYVQHAGLRKDMKTSLHASGANHVKWTPNGASRWAPNSDGYMMKWGEPEEFAPGGRTLIGIVIPTDHLASRRGAAAIAARKDHAAGPGGARRGSRSPLYSSRRHEPHRARGPGVSAARPLDPADAR